MILPLALEASGPSISLPTQQAFHSSTWVMVALPILCNIPSTSTSPWYSYAMHAIPPCPLAIMTIDLFTLGHHHHFSSLHMFCALYRTILQSSSIVSLHAYAHYWMFSQLWFFSNAIIVDQLQQYNCCRCFYNTLSRCMHCQIQRSYIACSLLIKITCY